MAAAGVEALKDVLIEVDAEAPASAVAAVQRAGAFALRAAAAQAAEQAELVEGLGHRQLPFQMSEVDKEGLASGRHFGYRGRTGCGDLSPNRLCRISEARGLLCF